MDKAQLRRWGIIGLILLAVLAVVYFWSRQQQAKRAREVPPDDRGIR